MSRSAREIADAVTALRERIAVAAHAAGRDPATIRIVAASKGRAAIEIAAAHDAGITSFGENRVQEWQRKRAACPPGIEWHLIGPLQRNKVRAAAGAFSLLHAVDRIEVAEAVSRVAGDDLVQPVLLEVNVSGEASKHGLAPEQAVRAARRILELPGIRLDGLMTIGHPDDPGPGFERLRRLRDEIAAFAPEVRELSMGMSGDLEAAIGAGATIVRPGTALFGPRPGMP